MSNSSHKHIVVIGAANADITGISNDPLSFSDSNPGRMILGAGGVGRNIADNFARLAVDDNITTYLLSAIGGDLHGKMVTAETQEVGVDLTHCQFLDDSQTATYCSIVDYNGEMRCAINDMEIVKQVNIPYLASKAELINGAKLIILDANLEADAIDFVCENFNHIPIFADTVSAAKADKVIKNIEYLHCLAPNLNEVEKISSMRVRNDDDLPKVAKFFHDRNIRNLCITLGDKGVFISSNLDGTIITDYLPAHEGGIVNANGAGDAFLAGLVYAFVNEMPNKQQASFAQACAYLTAQSEHTINKNISRKMVTDLLETSK